MLMLCGQQVVVNIPAAILIERMGRRMLFLTSQLICCLAMAALGAYFFIEEGNPAAAKSLAWLPLVSLIVFSAGFAYGIGPVPWVICGELIPRKVKGTLWYNLALEFCWFLSDILSQVWESQWRRSVTISRASWWPKRSYTSNIII